MNKPAGKGVAYAAGAYILWGIIPLYWKALAAINSVHLLAFRILLSLLFVSAILFLRKKTSWLGFFKNRRKALMLTVSATLISYNWGVYIWAVNSGRTIEAALGYYITPLISVLLGMFFFREKLNILQWFAFFFAITGVLLMTILSGSLPWVSIVMAFSFAFYGLLKKFINMSALETMGAETVIASPFGFMLLFAPFVSVIFPSWHSIGYIAELPNSVLFTLVFCGAVTSIPLYMFSKAAQLLPLSTLGFIQFVSPTMSFLVGVFVFREPFPWYNFIVFGCIWFAVLLYIVSINIASGRKTDQ